MKPSIYQYERRDVITRMNRHAHYHAFARLVLVIILAVLFAVLAFRTIAPRLSAAPVEGKQIVMVNGEEGDMTTLCARYRSDHLMTGEKMDITTRELCGF